MRSKVLRWNRTCQDFHELLFFFIYKKPELTGPEIMVFNSTLIKHFNLTASIDLGL